MTAAVAIADRVGQSGSSFYWAMRLMPRDRRAAMFAVYAFCREVDDVADGPGSAEAKRAALDDWREEIARLYDGRARHPIALALVGPIARFRLAREDLLAVVDGVAMDAAGPLRAPDRATLELYVDRVACAVGRLSVRVFGCPEPEGKALAAALGRALQLTNILRDLAEDAAMGRLYLPRETLAAHGIVTDDPARVLGHPALPAVCDAVAAEARAAFEQAAGALARCPRRPVRPAAVMAAVYRALLDRLCARGWRALDQAVRVPRWLKIGLAMRHGLL